VWIGCPKIDTLAHYEARFFGLTRARITNQKIAAIARSNNAILRASGHAGVAAGAESPASHNADPVDELLKALRWGKLKAIGPHAPLPPEFWDGQSSDPGTWPDLWFLSGEVLRLWPALDETPAAEGGSRAGTSLEAKGEEVTALTPQQGGTPFDARKAGPRVRALAEKLRELFGDAPPAKQNEEITREVREAPGRRVGVFSGRTLSRAKVLAWPQLKRARRD
jgi:hypothetical protein